MAFKILWYSIPTLLDSSNGAAITSRIILNQLRDRGCEIRVINCLRGDSELGLSNLRQVLSAPVFNTPEQQSLDYYNLNIDQINYYIIKSKDSGIADIDGSEQSRLFALYTQMLNAFNPDLVIGYSGDAFSTVMWAEAKARNIPVVYMVCNAMHHTYAFGNIDQVVVPSEHMCQYYKERSNVDMVASGIFIDPSRVVAPVEMRQSANGSYVTLINPEPSKGLVVFLKTAMNYLRRHPESQQRFLVVKCRSDYNEIMRNVIWENNTEEYRAEVARLLDRIDVAEHNPDVRPVYANTKVLVAPSLCNETWGAVATEANMNGIPALVTAGNGLFEAIGKGKGGIALPAPETSLRNYMQLPSDEEIEPFVDALERLLNEDWSQGCAESAAMSNLKANADKFYAMIEPLMQQGQKEKDNHKSFYFNQPTLERMHSNIAAAAQQVMAEQQAKQEQAKAPVEPSPDSAPANPAENVAHSAPEPPAAAAPAQDKPKSDKNKGKGKSKKSGKRK